MFLILPVLVRKWIVDILLASLLFAGAWQGDLLDYAWKSARGQFRILLNARSVKSYLADPSIADSLKQKVYLIQEIKQFTIDSLGFSNNKNYTTIYDQQGKPLLWVVTASERFALKPYYWKFPIVGTVSYKGFFSEEEAEEEAQWLERIGYETRIRQVNAWSTLGWFKDPIMTSMLDDEPGELANLIIHELSHRTVYIKSNVDYSENLANFIGDKGARLFLKYKYGEASQELLHYIQDEEDYKRFARYMLFSAQRLDSLYQQKDFISASEEEKEILKSQRIQEIIHGADTMQLHNPSYLNWLKKQTPNNALFIIFRQYNNQQDEFEEEFQKIAKGNLKAYVAYLKTHYPAN